MRIVFYISYKNEPELVALYHKLGSKLFSNFIRDALRHAIRPNYLSQITIPDNLLLDSAHIGEKIKINISITAEKDKDVIKLLQSIKTSMVTKFVKICTRLYLGNKCLESYFDTNLSEQLALSMQPHTPFVVYQLGESVLPQKQRKHRTPKPRIKRTCTKTADSIPESKLSYSTATAIPQTQPIESKPAMEPVSMHHAAYEEPVMTDTDNDGDDVLAMLESLLS